MQVPDASSLSANLSFENYLTDQTIEEAWNKAQKDVIVLHLVVLPCAEPKLDSLNNIDSCKILSMHVISQGVLRMCSTLVSDCICDMMQTCIHACNTVHMVHAYI